MKVAAQITPMRLTCAVQEQAWIDDRLRAGVHSAQVAIVDYVTRSLIFGRNSACPGSMTARANSLSLPVTSRRTGGGVVFSGPWMLGFHMLLPRRHPLHAKSHVAAFVAVGEAVQNCLAAFGFHSRLPNRTDMVQRAADHVMASLAWCCFAGISYGELLDAKGRKVLGLAQARLSGGLIVSGGLLLDVVPWEDLDFIHSGIRSDPSRMHDRVSPGVLAGRSHQHRVELFTVIGSEVCMLAAKQENCAVAA